ncbi:hypothetical protein [Peptostreptococcus porci]|uniref:hypothetical protein n=1 Tax=Peptostreptococcus porci TaxID=2652282 RepID=UPI002A915F13|nr:hypothetical protein [Peptostreptococcus porci]MDY5436525.1 hypothetical protein [Peptostreptococcus porci]
MKFGVRKPSPSKSLKARTTGKYKRAAKKAIIPGYGQKGTGKYKNPKKAIYNKAYNKTTFSATDGLTGSTNGTHLDSVNVDAELDYTPETVDNEQTKGCAIGCLSFIVPFIFLMFMKVPAKVTFIIAVLCYFTWYIFTRKKVENNKK